MLVLRVLHISVGYMGGQRYAAFALGLVDSPDLPAGVPRIELIEPEIGRAHV